MEAVKAVLRKLVRENKKELPGISEDSANQLAAAKVRVFLQHMDASDDMQKLYVQDVLVEAAKNDEEWAVEVTQIHLNAVIRPAYDKAVAAGVNPVPVLQANCGISEHEARNLVSAFEKADAPETKPDEDSETPAQDAPVPA